MRRIFLYSAIGVGVVVVVTVFLFFSVFAVATQDYAPMNLKYRKSVGTIGGVCSPSSTLQTMQIPLFAKKLYARSWNHELCLTSTAYLNRLSSLRTTSLRASNHSWICKEGSSCINSVNVLSECAPIASKNCSKSLSTSFNLFTMCYDIRKLEPKISRSLLAPILNHEDSKVEQTKMLGILSWRQDSAVAIHVLSLLFLCVLLVGIKIMVNN